MRRLVKSVPSMFRDEALEIFIPVHQRDLDMFEMKTGCYVFVRSTSFSGLLRLKGITGVVSLVTEGESNRPNKAIKVQDDYVQGIIKEAEVNFHKRTSEIEEGSFVRIVDGETRDYCGHVEVVQDGYAVVRIDLKTKRVLVETPVRNLLNLDHVPVKQQVFYYCSFVSELVGDKGREGQKLISDDLHLAEDWMDNKHLIEIPDPEGKAKRYTRQRTVTALVKRLVIQGNLDPLDIAKHVVASIRNKDIKTPKNLFIVYCIIKNNLRNYFREKDPKVANYREVIRRFGSKYKFSAQDIAALEPSLDVPISTLEICKDGRSKEARSKKKEEKLVLEEKLEVEDKRERKRERRRAWRRKKRRLRKEQKRLAAGGNHVGRKNRPRKVH